MTIKDCIDIVDNIKPNQYTIRDKVMWLSFIEEIIINDVLKTHEGYDGRYDSFEGYSEDKLSVTLIVPSPYDRLYTAYLKMKIDQENGETARYNNSMLLYNTYMQEYRKHYNKTHMPLDTIGKRAVMPPRKDSVGLTDAEYENLKRDIIAELSNIVATQTSDDKIQAVVKTYMDNNAMMFKGKPGNDGYTPQREVDYWTEDDKSDIEAYIDDKTVVIKADVEGIQKQINEEAHFRGYLSTNAKIQALDATPNDFAYSAESNTKWVYDVSRGWEDTGTPVPDQLTPASDTTPLINGEASVGKEEAYARGDHRHPTDATRVSVEEFNKYKSEVDNKVKGKLDAGTETDYVSEVVIGTPNADPFEVELQTKDKNGNESVFRIYRWTEDVVQGDKNLVTSGAVYDAIGDIDTALENIIAKYGLGGDVV